MESEREVELNTPLSARTYLEAYYDLDEPDDRAGLKPLLKSFEGRSLVTHAALADTWPDGDWQEPELIEEEAKITTQLSQLRGLEDTQGDNLKSLRDRSMDVLLESLLDQTEDNPHLMAEAELMSDFIPKLRAKFYVRAASLKPSSALIRLLCRALENEVEVDLSPFKTLTVDDLTAVVAILRKSKMKVLNLSDMPNLEESDLGKILGFGVTVPREIETGVQSSSSSAAGNEIRSLRALTLLENPQISLQYLTQYLGNYEIYHSELFRRAIRDEYYGATTIPSLEFVAPNIVSQLVFIGIAAYQTYDPKYRLENGQFEWKTMEHLRGPVRTLGSDKPFGYNQHLLDIPLPAPKMIECLMRVLQFFSFPSMTRYESWYVDFRASVSSPTTYSGCYWIARQQGLFAVTPLFRLTFDMLWSPILACFSTRYNSSASTDCETYLGHRPRPLALRRLSAVKLAADTV